MFDLPDWFFGLPFRGYCGFTFSLLAASDLITGLSFTSLGYFVAFFGAGAGCVVGLTLQPANLIASPGSMDYSSRVNSSLNLSLSFLAGLPTSGCFSTLVGIFKGTFSSVSGCSW